ncbi:UDP-phosphate galactose phosphotransferase, partial [Lacticaseibacillus rhamnosus]
MKQSAEWNGFKRLLTMIGDVGLFNLSILLAFYWRFGSDIPEWNFKMYEGSAVYISLLFLLVNFFLGVYVYYNRRISDIIFNTVLAQTITILGLTMITFMGRFFAFPRLVLAYSFLLSILILGIWRVFIYYMYIHFTSNYKVAVLSYEHELPAVLENFHSAKNNKHKVTYVVSDHFVENAKKIIDKVDIFYLTKSLPDEQRREIIDIIIKKEKTILLPSTFDNLMMLRPNLMNFEDESVMGITQFRIKPESAILKRIFDIVVGLLMLVVASPFMLVTAILVKLSSPGPIIYKQTRITLNQKEFKILKFRTM